MWKTYTKVYPIDWACFATGDGYWGYEQGDMVNMNGIHVAITYHDNGTVSDLYAEIDIRYETIFGREDDKPYTDSGVEYAVNRLISQHSELRSLISGVSWSEYGMQTRNTMNFDASLIRDRISSKNLLELGFTEQRG